MSDPDFWLVESGPEVEVLSADAQTLVAVFASSEEAMAFILDAQAGKDI